MQPNFNNLPKTQNTISNNTKAPLQFNPPPRKYFGQQKSAEMKKSSIFFSNPGSQNSTNYDSNQNPSTDFKSKFQTNQHKKSEGNLNFNVLDKRSPTFTNNFNTNFDKSAMYSSQIVTTTNPNPKKGGLQSLGKFVTTSHENEPNDKYQAPKKPFQPTFNQLKTQNAQINQFKYTQQKKNQFLSPTNYSQTQYGNFVRPSTTQYDNKQNYQNLPPKSYQYNKNPTNQIKTYSNTPINLKPSETPQTYNYQPKKFQTTTNDYKFDYSNDYQKKYQPSYKPSDYSNTNYNNTSSNVNQNSSINPYPVGSKEYYLQMSKRTTQQIMENKKLENQKKGEIGGPSFSKKQVSYQTTNDYLNYKKTSNEPQIAKKSEINQIIIPASLPFSKDKLKAPQISKQSSSQSNNNTKSSNLCKDDFHIGKKLGKGQFGEVFLVKHKKTGFVCAMKIIKKSTIHQQKVEDQLVRELKIQFFLHHNNIAALYGFFNDTDNVYLLLELCSQGQLFDILKEKRRLPEDQVSEIIQQVCNGLEYIHRQRIIHRDIKPQNVIMHLGVAKICDFGWAVYRADGMRTTFCGTPLYTSPQLLRGQKYDEKIDIWAVGILTYQLIVGRIPFRILSEGDMNKILSDEITFPEFVDVADVSKDFILKILKKNPQDRFEVQELLNHPFLLKKKPNPYKFDITI